MLEFHSNIIICKEHNPCLCFPRWWHQGKRLDRQFWILGIDVNGTDFAPPPCLSVQYIFISLVALAGSILAIASAAVGFFGIFRENRAALTIYATMLWGVFALYVAVGYIAFRRERNHLNLRLREEWIHDYTRHQRLLIQYQVRNGANELTRSFLLLLPSVLCSNQPGVML